jgi:trk system potassium uptake protein TrkH
MSKGNYVAKLLIEAESGQGNETIKTFKKTRDYFRVIFIAYFLITLIFFFIFIFCGLNIFDSLIHSMSGISTGGFSNYNDNISHFNNIPFYISLMILTFLGGMSYYLFYFFAKGRFSMILKNVELKFYILLIFVCTIIITIFILSNYSKIMIPKALFVSFFEVISMVSTSGYSLSQYHFWPTACIMLLFILMLIGGSSSSSAGGIKIFRLAIIINLLKININKKLHPKAYSKFKIEENVISSQVYTKAIGIIFSYIMLFILSTILISIDNNDMMTNASAALACLSNVGMGFNLIGPGGSFDCFSDFSKIVLIITMIAGRLEVLNLFVLFSRGFWKK